MRVLSALGTRQLVFHSRLHFEHQNLEFSDARVWGRRWQKYSHRQHRVCGCQRKVKVSATVLPRVQVESEGFSSNPVDRRRNNFRSGQHPFVPRCQQPCSLRNLSLGVLQEPATGAAAHSRAFPQRPAERPSSVLHFWGLQFSLWYRRCCQGLSPIVFLSSMFVGTSVVLLEINNRSDRTKNSTPEERSHKAAVQRCRRRACADPRKKGIHSCWPWNLPTRLVPAVWPWTWPSSRHSLGIPHYVSTQLPLRRRARPTASLHADKVRIDYSYWQWKC